MSNPYAISEEICNQIKDKNWLRQEIVSGKPVQEILGFSDSTMDLFYQTASKLFDEHRYKDTSDAFLFLVTLNPHHYDYWIGLGASTQWCGDYEAAIDAYEMAAICQIENPIPYFYLAKCLFAIHEREHALLAIEMALEYSDGISQYDDIYHQALAAKNLLLKEQ